MKQEYFALNIGTILILKNLICIIENNNKDNVNNFTWVKMEYYLEAGDWMQLTRLFQ